MYTHYPFAYYIYIYIYISVFAIYLTVDGSVCYGHTVCTKTLSKILWLLPEHLLCWLYLTCLTDFVGKCFNVSSSSCFFSSSGDSRSSFRSQSERRCKCYNVTHSTNPQKKTEHNCKLNKRTKFFKQWFDKAGTISVEGRVHVYEVASSHSINICFIKKNVAVMYYKWHVNELYRLLVSHNLLNNGDQCDLLLTWWL